MVEKRKDETKKRKFLLEEYRVLNESIQSRWSDTLLVDSIMIPSSLLVVTFAIAERNNLGKSVIYDLPVAGFIPILTLVLIAISYIAHYTTTKLDKFYIDRIKSIETELGISGHRSIYAQIKGTWWYKLRCEMYHFFFWILIATYIFAAIWLFKEIPIS